MCGLATAVLVLAMSMGDVNADPAADALSRLNELSQQAVQSREAVTAAQRDATPDWLSRQRPLTATAPTWRR